MNPDTIILLANLTILSAVLSIICLVALHIINPQLQPSWRMVSEYALGKQQWLLTCFFIFWGMSTLFLCAVLWNILRGTWGTIGLFLLLASAIGEIMGGLFDIKHKLHGAAFALGIPTLPVAALFISYSFYGDTWFGEKLVYMAHATWISVVLMAVSMMMLFSGFKKAGIPMGPNVEPPAALPAGVVAWSGYANRLLILVYIGWLIMVADVFNL